MLFLGAKYAKNVSVSGAAPQTLWGSLQCSPSTLAGFKEDYF